MTELSLPDPYIGPRTFTLAERDRFFGREREARELLALRCLRAVGPLLCSVGRGEKFIGADETDSATPGG